MEININAISGKLKEFKKEERDKDDVSKTLPDIEPKKAVRAQEILEHIKKVKKEMKKELLKELVEILPQTKLDQLLILTNYLNLLDKSDKSKILTSLIDPNAPKSAKSEPVEIDFKQLYVLLKNGVSVEKAANVLGIDVKTLIDHVNKYEKQLTDFKFFQQNKTDMLEYLQFRIYQTLSDEDILKISPAQRITMLGILNDKITDSKKLNRGKLNIEINIEQIQEQKKKAFIEIKGEELD